MSKITSPPSASAPVNTHRSRLLQGMAEVVIGKDYAAITIADIVSAAGVSKRSFYEHFESKEACFLALYGAASGAALRQMRSCVDPNQPWQNQVELALNAYLSQLSEGPGLVRALFIDIHYLGDAGAKARREVMQALANFMLERVNDSSANGSQQALSPTLAMAAVGGINELIMQAIETDRVAYLTELTSPASALVRLLTHSGPELFDH